MITVHDLLTKFDGLKTRNAKQIQTADPIGKNIRVVPNKTLARDARGYFAKNDAGGPDSGIVPDGQAAASMNLIESLFKGDHGDAKRDARWHRMYMGHTRTFPMVRPDGSEYQQGLPACPCHYCGAVLPMDFIEVDHGQPQANPSVAVLKVLHEMQNGYTVAGGAGKKSAVVGAMASAPSFALTDAAKAAVGALPLIHPKGYIGAPCGNRLIWRRTLRKRLGTPSPPRVKPF